MDQMSPLLSAIAENAILSQAELSAGTSKRIALTANSSESLVCIFKFKIIIPPKMKLLNVVSYY